METMAVTCKMEWLETRVLHICFLSGSMKMPKKVHTSCVPRQWLESLSRSSLQYVAFIFMPAHAGTKESKVQKKQTDKSTQLPW